MKNFFALTIASVFASALWSCSSQQTAWCSLDWPGSEKTVRSGNCRFEDMKGKDENTTIDFYSNDYSFVFPNSNNGINYERKNTGQSVLFSHNGYVLTVYPDGRP